MNRREPTPLVPIMHLPQPFPLAGERLLAACDAAQGEPAAQRPVALLAAALPQCGHAELMSRGIGEIVRLLLELHRVSFGPLLSGYAACTECASAMEFNLTADAALRTLSDAPPPAALEWTEDGLSIQLREANTLDLLAATTTPDDTEAGARLFARCLGFDDWCADARRRASLPSVQACFEALHAASELRCELRCPQCLHASIWDLDAGHFVWLEVRDAARRLLSDVHVLALHYGWSEAAITAMSQRRRFAYLERLEL